METPVKEIKTPIKKKKIIQTPQTPQTPTVDVTVRRRVSDILVTLHKCIQSWETNNTASFNTANTLCNLYSQWNNVKDASDVPEINDICKRHYYVKLASTREDLLKQLKKQHEKLKTLIKKMTSLGDNLKALYYLGLVSADNTYNDSRDTSDSNKSTEMLEKTDLAIFASWTTGQFYRKTRIVLNMYTKEYFLKCSLYNRFFQYRVEDLNEEGTSVLNQCINVWLHQPYIEERCTFLLDSMLVEAELK